MDTLGLGIYAIYLLIACTFVGVCLSILSAILAKRRGRSAISWFFLTIFYGLFGVLFLACSKTLNQGENRESDTLAKVLWALVVIPLAIIVGLIIIGLSGDKQDDELTEKVLNDMKKEQTINQRNIEIIQHEKNISYEEAQKLLDELNLRE